MKKRVLFICTGNSCRSQMAEGLGRYDFGANLEVFSAGTDPQGLNPLAVAVMAEIGIDISGQVSEPLDNYDGETFDYVISLCAAAHHKCPQFFGGVQRLHMDFADPPKAGTDREALLQEYRELRDNLRTQLTQFFRQEL